MSTSVMTNPRGRLRGATLFGPFESGMAALVTCASAAAELAVTVSFFGGIISPGELLACHAMIVAILCVWFRATWSPAGAPRHVATLLLSTAVLGPLGAFGTLLQMCAYTFFRRTAKPFAEWYALVIPAETESLSVRTYQAIAAGAMDVGRQRSLTSFVDVLSLGTHQQQRALLVLIAEHFRPSFAPALKLALQHQDPAVRVLAATAVNKITAQRARRLDGLWREVRESPTDAGSRRRLAAQMIEDIESGLVGVERCERLMRDALSTLLKSVELDEATVATAVGIAKLLLWLGRDREVIAWLDKHPGVRDLEPEAVAVYLGALFNMRRYAAIRTISGGGGFAPVIDAMAPEPRFAAALWRAGASRRLEVAK